MAAVGSTTASRTARPHARVQMGVDAAEFGAVGDAEIDELLVAERLAHQVHVAGRARCRRGAASSRSRLASADVFFASAVAALFGGVVRSAVHRLRGVDLLVAPAGHALAFADPARIEAHEVIALAQFLVIPAESGQGGDPGAAGAAEVEHQGADPLVRSVALARIIARSMVLPFGFAQSSGTARSAHSQSPPGALPVPWSAVGASHSFQRGFWPVSEPGRPEEPGGAAGAVDERSDDGGRRLALVLSAAATACDGDEGDHGGRGDQRPGRPGPYRAEGTRHGR